MDIIEEMETLEKVEVWLVENKYPTELSKLHILAVISAMEEIFGWIKIEDKVPEQGEKVLWYDAMFNKVHAFALDYPEMHDGDYTHWMPMPSPPVSETPLLDQLESGPWPSFVQDLKKLANKPFEDRSANCCTQSCQVPMKPHCSMKEECGKYTPTLT